MRVRTGLINGSTMMALLLASSLGAAGQALVGRVARLTLSVGSVQVERAGGQVLGAAVDPAQQNMPLIEGQTLSTGDDGQAEVEFEDGSVARLTPNSLLRLDRLTAAGAGAQTRLSLMRGLAYFELRVAPGVGYSVIAGDERLSPIENATVRVNLDEPPAGVAVLDGVVRVERTGGLSTEVRAGEGFRGDPTDPGRYFLTQEIAADSWDQWNEGRDQGAADTASRQTPVRENYAGTQGFGWSDLDANGNWYDVAGQGQVWQPEGGDEPGFDPYGNGSWVWYPNAGYVWASGYAWGWTPFRCGGWSYWNGFGWGWTPNAGCGGFGFGGGYGGFGGGRGGYLNIVRAPEHFPLHRPPSPDRGGLHPIVAVRNGWQPVHGDRDHAERTVAGVPAIPLQRGALGYTSRGGTAVGSSLRRDFPVDRTTHTAVLGITPGDGTRTPAPRQTLSGTSYVVPAYGQPVVGHQRAAPPVTVNSAAPNVIRPAWPGTAQPGIAQPGANPGYPAQGYPRAPPSQAGSAPRAPQAVSRPAPQLAPPSRPSYTPPPAAAPRSAAPAPAAPSKK